MRFTPVMLALLLALSPGAVASAPTAPTTVQNPASVASAESDVSVAPSDTDTVGISTNGNTSAVMTLGTAPARTAFDSPSLSLGSSLSMDRKEFETQFDANVLDRQVRSAATVEKRKQILNRYRYRIENRIISLKATEQQATREFSNGTISRSEYLRTLGYIDSKAHQTRRAIDTLEQQASRTQFGFYARSLKTKMVELEGPVRDRIRKSMQGKTDPTRIHVSTTANGVVLSMVTNGQYVREVHRMDNRDPSVSSQISIDEAYRNVVNPRFPWATIEENRLSEAKRRYPSLNVLRFRYTHPHGDLTAYVDRGTEKIYHTVQYKQLTGQTPLPTGPSVSNTSNNVTITADRTYAGGPLRVKLTNATGDPVQGDVTVNGERIGQTNSEGLLWTLSPAEQFEVSATYDFHRVNVTTTPVKS